MPKSEKISLKAFWEAVEQKLAKYSTDELRAILRAMAQATPPTQRETFLDKLTPVKGAVVSVQKRLRQDEVLAGCLVLRLGNKAWYLLGASQSQMRELRPNQLLQWEAMRWARSAGAEAYDMWGLPEVLEPGQPMWGLYQFKRGFGGDLRRWVGAYDYVARPNWRRLWQRVYPVYLRLRGRTSSPMEAEGAAA